MDNKLKELIKLDKGSKVESILGKYVGQRGEVESLEGKNLSVKFEGNEFPSKVQKRSVIAI